MKLLLVSLFLVSINSFAKDSDWAVPASKDYPPMDVSKNPDEKFIPNVISQDSLGICYAASAATMINFEQCRIQNVDCKAQPDSARISMLGIARYQNKVAPDKSEVMDKNYTKISNGGAGGNVLIRATDKLAWLPTEKCVSLEKILSKDSVKADAASEAQVAIWRDFQKYFLDYKKAKEGGCTQCQSDIYASALQTISDNLTLEDDPKNTDRVNQSRILIAFGKDTYEEALNTLLYPPQCGNAENGIEFAGYGDIRPYFFPKEKSKVNAKALNDKIVSILETRQPVMYSFCGADCDTKNPRLHEVVIVGHRKICKKKQCRYAFKVQNSWGKSWQVAHNDGWVEGENLLKHATQEVGTLTWLGKFTWDNN